MTREEIEAERVRFETVMPPLHPESGICWSEHHQQYLTSNALWKKFALGRSNAFEGWLAAKQDAKNQFNIAK